MKNRLFAIGLLAVSAVRPVAAQQSCTGGTAVQDACQKGSDFITFIAPQLSTALAGGNATLGQGGALGGLGHFALGIRASAVNGSLPKIGDQNFSTTGAQATTYTANNQFVPGLSADAAIGLWRGVSVGITHVGGIDALLTATYLPNVGGNGNGDAKLTVNGSNTKFGFGVRVGLLEESVVTPGVSFTYLQRDLPSVSMSSTTTGTVSGTSANGTIALNDLAIKSTAWRITAAKDLLIFGLSAGVGQDKYTTTSSLLVTVNTIAGAQSGTSNPGISMTRTNAFVGASVNLFLFKLEGELGTVSGGSLPALKNNFGADAASSRTYFTLGLRFGR